MYSMPLNLLKVNEEFTVFYYILNLFLFELDCFMANSESDVS